MEAKSPLMGFKEITAIMPHRYPFLFIDKVVDKQTSVDRSNRTGWKVRCIKNITINEPYFAGHFPHRPVVPGVIMIEMLAQGAAMCCFREEDGKQDMALCGITDAKFRAPVVPGDVLEIVVECTKDRRQMMLFRGEIFCDGKLVCEANFLARMFDMVV